MSSTDHAEPRTETVRALFDDWLSAHDAEVEAAVRAQIAADIRSTFTDPERRRPRDPAGEFATDLLNDWQWAELIAKGGA